MNSIIFFEFIFIILDGFSRFTFQFRKHLLFTMLATKLLPPITAIVPLYLAIVWIGSVDTLLNLIVIYTALNIPFATWLMKAFIDGIPRELEEAARIEGLGLFLIAIATKFVLDPVKFGAFCDRVDKLMIQWIEWHPSVPSVHLDLKHGQTLMEHFFPIPLGMLSEVSNPESEKKE